MLVRAVIAFLAFPGVVAYGIPFLLRPEWTASGPWRAAGALVVTAGSILLLWCVRDFYVVGRGTLAPWSPPRRLVTTGWYRHTRNPMYVAVLLVLLGWSTWFASGTVLLYAAFMAVVFHLRVRFFEEPRLEEMFGDSWRRYRSGVPRWMGARSRRR